MAGATANEGAKVMADLLYTGASADRGVDLQMGLFTNAGTLAELKALALAAITEPTGGGYARKIMTNGNFVSAGGQTSYPTQTFTTGAGGYAGQVRGYFIATTGTTPRLLHIEIDPLGPYTQNATDIYNVTFNDLIS